MTKSTLVVRIEFDNDKRPAVVDDLLSNMCSYDNNHGEYAVTFASWTDAIAEKEKLERLAEMVKNPIKHVRADLITGDANEPLEEGQFRWVSVGGERHAARLEEMLNDYGNLDLFFCTTDGCSWSEEELDFIGPVIRPPEEQ